MAQSKILLVEGCTHIHRYAERLKELQRADVEIMCAQTVSEAKAIFELRFNQLTHVLIGDPLVRRDDLYDVIWFTQELNNSPFPGKVISISSEFYTRNAQRAILEKKHGLHQTDPTTYDPKHDAIKNLMGYPIVRTHYERMH